MYLPNLVLLEKVLILVVTSFFAQLLFYFLSKAWRQLSDSGYYQNFGLINRTVTQDCDSFERRYHFSTKHNSLSSLSSFQMDYPKQVYNCSLLLY